MQWFHRRSTKCGRGRRTNSARISHPPPFRRVTKNGTNWWEFGSAARLFKRHLKDHLGSIARVGYCIPVPDFYLVLHGLRCQKSTITDKSINLSTLSC